MHAAERERLVQIYNVDNAGKAVPICGGCLAALVLIVVLGSPSPDEYAQASRPTAIAAAPATLVGAQTDQHRQHTFEARREAFARDHR